MRRYCFILNPTAGNGRAKALAKQIESFMNSRGASYEILETEAPGHGERLARAAALDGADCLVAVGGDGTLLEVVNAVAGLSVSVGVLPCGTGNDFARSMELPQTLQDQLEVLWRGRERAVDLGRANGRYFINVFSLGIDALITLETSRIKAALPGTAAYVAATLKTLFRFRPVDIVLEADDFRYQGKVMLVAVGNGAYYGGGMKIAPQARLDSGSFQVCVVKALGRFDFLRLFPLVFKGAHVRRKEVLSFSAGHLRIQSDGQVYLNADGDVVGQCPVEIDIMPGAMRVLAP